MTDEPTHTARNGTTRPIIVQYSIHCASFSARQFLIQNGTADPGYIIII